MILDTNALSDWWKRIPSLKTLLGTSSKIYVPVPALAEFRFGLLQSNKKALMQHWLTDALASTVILGIDDATTFQYADLRLALKQAGTPIPMNDLWIAAIARQHDLPIVSRDTHFDLIPGIRRLEWQNTN